MALLYHFNSSKHALSNIKKKALKVSLIDRLNDPFECRPAGVLDHDLNEALDGVRTDIEKSIGMLCLSRDWKHPLRWGHYADSHAGICLGFEFTGPKESRVAVDYEAERIVIGEDVLSALGLAVCAEDAVAKGLPCAGEIQNAIIAGDAAQEEINRLYRKTFKLKHPDWEYEEETRLFVRLAGNSPTQRADHAGNLFEPWGDGLALREITLGVNCRERPADIAHRIDAIEEVEFFRARLHKSKFQLDREKISIK